MTLSGLDSTLQTYSKQNTTVTIGFFKNTFFNPYGHIGIGIGENALFGLNPKSDWQFYKYKLTHLWGGSGVPGAVTQQVGGSSKGEVILQIAGIQARIIQDGIEEGIMNPPNYDIFGGSHTCDCASWPQAIFGAAGINTGQLTNVPRFLMNQADPTPVPEIDIPTP
jgi:hypothetical protein